MTEGGLCAETCMHTTGLSLLRAIRHARSDAERVAPKRRTL